MAGASSWRSDSKDGHRDSKKIKKKLIPHSDDGPNRVETDTSEEDLADLFERAVSICEEKNNGEWLSPHSWDSDSDSDSEMPWDSELKMKSTVENSKSYPTSSEWTKRNGDVDLAKIYSNLLTFVQSEMQGSINGSRQELKQIICKLHNKEENPIPQSLSDCAPHTREIFEEITDNIGKDTRSEPSKAPFKATSLHLTPMCPAEENYFHYDCEYMLQIFVPSHLLSLFGTQQCEKARWIQEIKSKHMGKRWIFIPSFRRAQIALLEWPEDEIAKQKSTIRILVVRPSEFAEYVQYCGHMFPVICLPQDEIGAGYPRYWIQKIALRLKLQFIWMIDDSVECFYEYDPKRKPPKRENEGYNYEDYRRRKFGLVFERIEYFVEKADGNEKPIAAMSPRRWNPLCQPQTPFSCAPPQCAVYLNLRALREKNVHYRPELKTLEDMIFGYECEQKGLKVYRDNRVLLQDHNQWNNTGASSPSVKVKQR